MTKTESKVEELKRKIAKARLLIAQKERLINRCEATLDAIASGAFKGDDAKRSTSKKVKRDAPVKSETVSMELNDNKNEKSILDEIFED